MRFESVRVRGLGPFHEEVTVNLSAMAGQLVAVCGLNGAGKSTLLELLAGALYRKCPTRGTLAELATTRDAFVEVKVVNGRSYTIRQQVDAVSKKGEVTVDDETGKPVLDSGKVSQFDEWAADHLTQPEVLYTSSFAVQGRRGFLDLTPTERKQVLVRVLGLERFERMADNARERASGAKAEAHTLRARLDDQPYPNITDLVEQRAGAEARVVTAERELAGARKALERAVAAAADTARARELAEQRAGVEQRLARAKAQIADIEERIRNNRSLLDRAAAICAADARTTAIEQECAGLREQLAAARAEAAAAENERNAATRASRQAGQTVREAVARVERAQERLKDRDRVFEAQAAVISLGELETDAIKVIHEIEAKLVEIEKVLIGGKDQRITALRKPLLEIADARVLNGGECNVAARAVLADNAASERGERAPKELQEGRAELTKRRRSLDGLREQKSHAERLAARAADIDAAEAELVAAQEDATAAVDAAAIVRMEEDAIAAKVTAMAARPRALDEALRRLAGELSGLAPDAKKKGDLDQAQARIEERESQLTAAREDAAAIERELSQLPQVDAANTVDLSEYERRVAGWEQEERVARDQAAMIARSIVEAEAAVERIKKLQASLAEAESVLADWTRLGQDLGRDGLQAMELDAALPELNAMANELLHSCVGPRFTVELKTDRLSSDGKRVIEDLDVRVLDTEHGRDDNAETYSGGECVIVGEAVALALTMLACRRSGIQHPTLVRDESGAALDPENGRAYVAMLRRAASAIGADKVLFVTHTPELQELADSRISITAEGKVEVHA